MPATARKALGLLLYLCQSSVVALLGDASAALKKITVQDNIF